MITKLNISDYERKGEGDSADDSSSIREYALEAAIKDVKDNMHKEIAKTIAEIKASITLDPNAVSIGDTIRVLYEDGEVEDLLLVETGFEANMVTLSSPLGNKLFGKFTGEVVEYTLPNGDKEKVKIISITKKQEESHKTRILTNNKLES